MSLGEYKKRDCIDFAIDFVGSKTIIRGKTSARSQSRQTLFAAEWQVMPLTIINHRLNYPLPEAERASHLGTRQRQGAGGASEVGGGR